MLASKPPPLIGLDGDGVVEPEFAVELDVPKSVWIAVRSLSIWETLVDVMLLLVMIFWRSVDAWVVWACVAPSLVRTAAKSLTICVCWRW